MRLHLPKLVVRGTEHFLEQPGIKTSRAHNLLNWSFYTHASVGRVQTNKHPHTLPPASAGKSLPRSFRGLPPLWRGADFQRISNNNVRAFTYVMEEQQNATHLLIGHTDFSTDTAHFSTANTQFSTGNTKCSTGLAILTGYWQYQSFRTAQY